MDWFEKALTVVIKAIGKAINFLDKKPVPLSPGAAGTHASAAEKGRIQKKEQQRKERAKKAKAKKALRLVIDGAKIQCSLCSNPMGTLMVTNDTPTLQGKKIATVKDRAKSNLLFTGTCTKSPNGAAPCASVIQPMEWKDTGSFKVQDESPLLMKSTIKCVYGGTDIIIKDCGQRNVYAYDMPAESKTEAVQKTDINFTLFFDGTRNNMKNTEAREEYFKLNGIKPFEDPKWKEGANKTKAGYYETIGNKRDDSYESGYSNVALLSKYFIKELKNQEDLRDFAYVEGIATGSKEQDAYVEDSLGGYTLGQGETGIEAKVEKGSKYAAKRIDKIISSGKKTDVITINVFGFSRGAAAARSFLNEIGKAPKEAFKDYHTTSYGAMVVMDYPAVPKHGVFGKELTRYGIETDKIRFRICFAGLFDTVSSHGLIKSNDVKDLGLSAVKKAKKTLHLVASDEHRYFFPLVNIKSAGGNEKILPGVHSDIGGSYVDNTPEHKKALAMGIPQLIESRRRKLIRHGWYKKDQLKIIKEELLSSYLGSMVPGRVQTIMKTLESKSCVLRGEKANLSVAYSYIPLHIMCDYAMMPGIWMKFKEKNLKDDCNLNTHTKLEDIKDRLYHIVFEDGPTMDFHTRKQLEKEIDAIRPGGPKKQYYKPILERMLDQLDDLEAEAGMPIKLEAFITDPDLKRKIKDHNTLLWLRNEYLHSSADWLEPGFNPTPSGNREIYHG